MDPIYSGRYTADVAGELVLFRIGMRFNGWRGVLPALSTFAKMPGMLAEQSARPEIGMLWSSTALSWPVVSLTQFWRSFEDLERYALAPDERHTRAMRWFNRLGRRGVGVGIWHETYRVSAGSCESIYANMPRYGLGAAAKHRSLAAASTARARMDGETIARA